MFRAFPLRCWSVPCYSALLSLPSAFPLLLLAAWSLPLFFWVCWANRHFVIGRMVVGHWVARWIDWHLVWLVAASLGKVSGVVWALGSLLCTVPVTLSLDWLNAKWLLVAPLHAGLIHL